MSIHSNQEFFGELREWSERKLKILEGYLDSFVKVTGSRRETSFVYYVDAFAGAGLYRDGEKGSALRAAELAQRYQKERKRYRLKCINVEVDRANFENLEANTAGYEDLVLNLYGTFADNINHILQETTGSPALFFLDPFGVKGIDWSLIRQIIHRGHISDLWIRFDHTAVRRLAGRYSMQDAGARKSFAILCRTYGINDPEQLHNQLAGTISADRKQNAIDLYVNRLAEEFDKVRQKGFAAAFSIRSITEQDKYALVFAAGHPRGAIIASEMFCSADETYRQDVKDYKTSRPYQPSLFPLEPSPEDIFQDKVTRLSEAIWQACQGETISRLEIYERILPEWFGRIRSTHLTKALKKLQDEGHIQSATGPSSNEKTIFSFRETE